MGYHGSSLYANNLLEDAKTALETLKEHKIMFNKIAGIGLSGTIFASALAIVAEQDPVYCNNRIGLMIFRKETDTSNHGFQVEESPGGCRNVLIVDDFVDSGYTMKDLIHRVMDRLYGGKIVGVITRNQDKMADLPADLYQTMKKHKIKMIA